MSEKLYEFLLKLYPEHFRRTYGDEALRLVRDRARRERGFLSSLRLWLDLLWDFATSLPREYAHAPTTPFVAAQPLNGEHSFQLLAKRSLNPAPLCLGAAFSIVLFAICAFVVGRRNAFPVLLQIPPSLQERIQRDLIESESDAVYSFCMTAQRDSRALHCSRSCRFTLRRQEPLGPHLSMERL